MVKSPIFSLMRRFFGNEAHILFFLEKVYIFPEICTFLCLGVYFQFSRYLVQIRKNVHFDRTCGNSPKYPNWQDNCPPQIIAPPSQKSTKIFFKFLKKMFFSNFSEKKFFFFFPILTKPVSNMIVCQYQY